MPNIASARKEEIVRLTRKELRGNTDSLKKTVASYRSEIASLKRRVEALERQAKKLAKGAPKPAPAPVDSAEGDASHRWSAKGFAKHRARLGLSAADYGKLLGASALSVYKWENGQVRPRAHYLPSISTVRKMGKREAVVRLGEIET
jgi:DNA-binding transcriptional regulator YiaG